MSSEMILKIKDKLTRSSGFYSTLVARKKRDREIYGGNFWTTDVISSTDRVDRICRNFSMYAKYMNAIVSPFSKSPYHAELEDPDGIYKKIQENIDNLENSNNAKYVFTEALRHACIEGVGFFVMSIVDGEVTVEAVRDTGHVALDPSCQELDASDCEYAAIVDYMALSKAKRLYGDDVANYDGSCILSDIGTQWTIPSDAVPVVTYYEMNEQGKVSMWKACGNKIVTDEVRLEITRVPVFRICFNEVVRNNKIDYNGIVDMTADLQFGMNLAYSTLLERANRSPKANFLMPAKAIDGLKEYYQKLQTKESLVCLYNGDVPPTPIIESYQTQDLLSTVQGCNDLMASVIGVPSDGVQPFVQNQTATEILVQQANSESNVNSLYSNAYNSIFSFTKTLCELYCWQENIDKLPTFKLVNGPEIITKLQKRRQQLLAISQLVDDKTKKILAKAYISTLDDDVKSEVLPDIIANSEDIIWVSDAEHEQDPYAVNTLNQMNAVLDETQNALEQSLADNAELKKEIDSLNMQLMNQKEQILKDVVFHNDEMRLKEAQLQLDAAEKNVEIDAKQGEANVNMTKEMISLEKEKIKLANEQQKAINKEMEREFDYASTDYIQ
jgi:hypothetical protein